MEECTLGILTLNTARVTSTSSKTSLIKVRGLIVEQSRATITTPQASKKGKKQSQVHVHVRQTGLIVPASLSMVWNRKLGNALASTRSSTRRDIKRMILKSASSLHRVQQVVFQTLHHRVLESLKLSTIMVHKKRRCQRAQVRTN